MSAAMARVHSSAFTASSEIRSVTAPPAGSGEDAAARRTLQSNRVDRTVTCHRGRTRGQSKSAGLPARRSWLQQRRRRRTVDWRNGDPTRRTDGTVADWTCDWKITGADTGARRDRTGQDRTKAASTRMGSCPFATRSDDGFHLRPPAEVDRSRGCLQAGMDAREGLILLGTLFPDSRRRRPASERHGGSRNVFSQLA